MNAARTHKFVTPLRLIFVTMMIDMMGVGLLVPIFPELIRRFSDDPAFVSTWFGYFIASYALMQFLAAPVLGALSDKYGRRPVLLVSLIGAGIDYLIMAFAPTMLILFLGRIVSGITGASMTVSNSYIADISDDGNRAANFGLMGAAFGIGFIIGPIIGGLLGHFNPLYPFIGAAILNLGNALLSYFFLPESLPREHRRPVQSRAMNPFRLVLAVLKPSPILVLVLIFAVLHLATNVHPSNWTLYTEIKFGWTALDVGISLTAHGLIYAISQVYLTRHVVPKIGENRALQIGLALCCIELALFAIAPQGWMMYLIMALFFAGGLAMPCLQSLIARSAPPSEQGELQGSLTAIASLCAVVAPLFFAGLFGHFTAPDAPFYFPGAAYIAAAVLAALGLGLFALWQRRHPAQTAAAAGS
jgi:DHA1 family tetracycline resistance protein-like MFS transporter